MRVYFAVEMLPRGGHADQLHAVDEPLLIGRRSVAPLGHGIHCHSPAHALWAHRRPGLFDLNRKFPQFKILSLGAADFSFGLSFIKPSLHFFLIQLSQAFSIQGILLVVGVLMGPLQVVLFSTMRTMVDLIRSFLDSSPMRPGRR